jgi:hypothetical protein
MQAIQQIEPISSMQNQPSAVLALLANGPVILAQRSRAAAVLVSLEEWNAIARELEELRQRPRLTAEQWTALCEAQAIAARNEPTISHEELKAQVLRKIADAQG